VAQNNTFLPVLKGKHQTVYPIKQAPERGKGIIYSIEWGFRVDKGNNYSVTGEYVGLTSNSAAERFFTHMQSAKRLKYGYGVIDGEKASIIGGSTKEGSDETSQPKLFYIPFRTAMGPNAKNINPNQTYKYLSVIDHVNLFDLAYTEHINITQRRKTYNPSDGGYAGYADLVRRVVNTGGGKIGFNSTPGGEGNKINKGGLGYAKLTDREMIMAAFYFITEGRGSGGGSLRGKIGITGSLLADDIASVFLYFRDNATGYEKMGTQASKIANSLVKTKGEPKKILIKRIDELGIQYFKTTGGGKISKRENLINTVIKYGTGAGSEVSISRWDIQNFINAADNMVGFADQNRGINLLVFNVDDKRSEKKIIRLIKDQKFMIKNLGVSIGLGLLQKRIRKELKQPDYEIPSHLWKTVYSNLDKAMKELKEKPELKAIVEKHEKSMSEKAKSNQKYKSWATDFD
jgi:hypothetical protein